MSGIEKRFYILRAVGGKENKVKEYLEAEIRKDSNLRNYISRVIVPTEKVIRNIRGKNCKKERVFLPGYVIIEAVLESEIMHLIKNINFVFGLLGGDKPIPLRSSEVDRILGKIDEMQDQTEEFDVSYVVGETVKIIFGPFTGFYGEIEEIYSEKKRLKVMVKIFGRKNPLELGYLQVEKE